MPGISMGLALWNPKHRSTRSKSSISSVSTFRSPSSPGLVRDGFGIPSPDDPDPFGVRALELAGLSIKEAGSRSRPSSDAFDYKPSPTSPIFRLSTQSIDAAAVLGRDSRRNSKRSCLSVDHGTQTANIPSPPATEPLRELCNSPPPIEEEPAEQSSPSSPHLERHSQYTTAMSPLPTSPTAESHDSAADDEFSESDTDSVHDIVVEQVVPSFQVLNSPIATKPKIVNITKRHAAPALPTKSPLRAKRMQLETPPTIDTSLGLSPSSASADAGPATDDASSTYSSPSSDRSTFDTRSDKTSSHGTAYSPNPWTTDRADDGADADSLKNLQLFLTRRLSSPSPPVPTAESPLDLLPPLSDADDAASLADSDATHHDDDDDGAGEPHGPRPYGGVPFAHSSGETLAGSVSVGEGAKARGDDDDGASVSSFYAEDELEGEVFHEASDVRICEAQVVAAPAVTVV